MTSTEDVSNYNITTRRFLRDQAMFLFDYDLFSGLLTNKIQEYKIQPKRLIFPIIVKASRKNKKGKVADLLVEHLLTRFANKYRDNVLKALFRQNDVE